MAQSRRKASIHWLAAAVAAAIMTVPLAVEGAERMVLGEYFTADW